MFGPPKAFREALWNTCKKAKIVRHKWHSSIEGVAVQHGTFFNISCGMPYVEVYVVCELYTKGLLRKSVHWQRSKLEASVLVSVSYTHLTLPTKRIV